MSSAKSGGRRDPPFPRFQMVHAEGTRAFVQVQRSPSPSKEEEEKKKKLVQA